MILSTLNRYALNDPVEKYPGTALVAFQPSSYEWSLDYGMVRQFPTEQYYWAEDRVFLGARASEAIVAAVNGRIYKISFRFVHTDERQWVAFGEQALSFLSQQMGPPHKVVDENGRTLCIWEDRLGNASLERELFETVLILTSSAQRTSRLPFPFRWLSRFRP